MIGYWSGFGEPEDYPNPQLLVRNDWDTKQKLKIVEYLKKGHMYRGFWDYANCRFDDNRPFEDMGSREFTDGEYVWPEGLSVYVDEYNVGLPISFINHMINHNFIIPENINNKELEVDLTFWKNWSSEQAKHN